MSNSVPASNKIRFKCDSCDAKLAAPAKHIGATIRCPKCENRIEIPATSTADEPQDVAEARQEWSLARCPDCEEVIKVRDANRGVPVVCPECDGELIVSAK